MTDPADLLLTLAHKLQAPAVVAKRATTDTVRVRIADLQVDHDYQRPPDREKVLAILEHLKAGGTVDPITVNQRPDGSLWITDGQHRAMAAAAHGLSQIDAHVTSIPVLEEPAATGIMAKVTAENDVTVAKTLLGFGARLDGKQLRLDLGDAGTVTYLPHSNEFAGTGERGALRAAGPNAGVILTRLGLV